MEWSWISIFVTLTPLMLELLVSGGNKGALPSGGEGPWGPDQPVSLRFLRIFKKGGASTAIDLQCLMHSKKGG